MTVQKRSIFGSNAVVAEQDDLGAEGTHSAEPNTHGALGSESAHGDVASYRTSWDESTGEKPGQSAGFALCPNVGFSGHAYGGSETGSDTSGYGRGLAGEDSFSSHGYHDSDTGSDTSGYGKGIGNTDPLSRHDSI